MKLLRNILISSAISFSLVLPAYAQFTILPYTSLSLDRCKASIQEYEIATDQAFYLKNEPLRSEILGCAVNTGRISLSMIPFFITYFANFLLSLVGLVAMLFVVLGGYWYVFGGLTDQKEKGKKFIANALKGMVVAILAWVIVSVVVNVVTS
jgi:hypothetical protein